MTNPAASGTITIAEYNDPGFKHVFESKEWAVAIKNYQPLNDLQNLGPFKRHLLSDEVFILLEGKCVLLYDDSANQAGTAMVCEALAKGKVYCVGKGVWHATAVSRDVKLIIVEDRNTSKENTEALQISQQQIGDLTQRIQPMLEV